MNRRQLIQAMAVLPVVGFLPKVAGARCCERDYDGDGNCDRHPEKQNVAQSSELVKVEFVIVPAKEGELAPFFQHACEQWFRANPKYRPVGDMFFEPCQWDGSPWLLHPSWALDSAENPVVITCRATEAFRRPMVVDRAVGLRQHFYWRAEFPPMPYGAMAEDIFQQRLLANRAWRKEQRQTLGYVVVKFDAVPVS